jgi:hypothetical protein
MMSQNHQETKDRLRSEHDYQVNLKTELEIRHLHEKRDHLLSHQWECLVEIQQVQLLAGPQRRGALLPAAGISAVPPSHRIQVGLPLPRMLLASCLDFSR